ncbi:MAG: hypothetical protein ACRETC_03375 [Gammaproteobacteria bacterium]
MFAVLAVLVWFYLLAMAVDISAVTAAVNLAGPLVLGVAALVQGYRLLRRKPEAIWTPYAWFLAAIVLFYSIGPLIYPLAGPRTLTYAQSFLPINADELLRTNVLDAVGILVLLSGFRLVSGWSRRRAARAALPGPQRAASIQVVALTFLLVGGALEYLLILPWQFGLYHFVLPGVINNLGDLYLLGLMVLAYSVAQGKQNWRLLFAVLWAIQIVVSLLVFSKQQLILTIALPAVGAYLAHRRLSRLLTWGLVLGVVYFTVGQLVLYGRGQIAMRTGDINQATLTQRVNIVRGWFDEGMPSTGARVSSGGTGWARLNYAPEQTFAMARHDHGQPGHTLRNVAIVLIPRAIWPNKPVTTEMAVNFYQLVTGRRGTHLGLGIFGEGYWDYGWPGVIGLSFITGLIFGILSNLSMDWMRRRAFEYLPSIFLGINMGIVGTTEFFVNSVVGATGFFFAYMVLVWVLKQVFSGRKRRGSVNRRMEKLALHHE